MRNVSNIAVPESYRVEKRDYRYSVVNEYTGDVQSAWPTIEMAESIASELNSWNIKQMKAIYSNMMTRTRRTNR